MSRSPQRTALHAPPLIRLLSELDVLPPQDAISTVAERLGQWLDFTQAIELYAALSPRSKPVHAQTTGDTGAHEPLPEALKTTRDCLADAIVGNYVHTGRIRIRLPVPDAGAPLEIAADYTPYQRYYLAHQREMEQQIAALRQRARDALTTATASYPPSESTPDSDAGNLLAALDAAFDTVLAGREHELLARVPTLLQTRFTRLYRAHQHKLTDVDDPASWLAPDAWLGRFCQEMQTVLLAELDLRLQTVSGLIDTYSMQAATLP